MIGIIMRWDLFASLNVSSIFGIVNFLCSFVHILSLKEVEFIRKLVRRTNQKNQRTERGKTTEKEKVVRFYFGISDLFNILTQYGH